MGAVEKELAPRACRPCTNPQQSMEQPVRRSLRQWQGKKTSVDEPVAETASGETAVLPAPVRPSVDNAAAGEIRAIDEPAAEIVRKPAAGEPAEVEPVARAPGAG